MFPQPAAAATCVWLRSFWRQQQQLTAGTLWLVINWKIKQERTLSVIVAKPYASEGCCTSPLTWDLKTQISVLITLRKPWVPNLRLQSFSCKQGFWRFSGYSLEVGHYNPNHFSSVGATIWEWKTHLWKKTDLSEQSWLVKTLRLETAHWNPRHLFHLSKKNASLPHKT